MTDRLYGYLRTLLDSYEIYSVKNIYTEAALLDVFGRLRTMFRIFVNNCSMDDVASGYRNHSDSRFDSQQVWTALKILDASGHYFQLTRTNNTLLDALGRMSADS